MSSSHESKEASSSCVKEFASYTTAHGIGRLGSAASGSFTRRLWLWALFILAAYAGLSLHSLMLVRRYVSQPRSTKLDPNIEFEYPDVYLCNANPVSYSKSLDPIADTGKFARAYSSTETRHFMRMLRREVRQPRERRVVQFLAQRAMQWQRNITAAMMQHNHEDLTRCRHTLTGTEFEGNVSKAQVMDAETLRSRRAGCVSWLAAKLSLEHSRSVWLRNFSTSVPPWRHSNCATPPFHFREIVAFKKHIHSYSELLSSVQFEFQGPGCFHNDSGTVDFDFCGVPVCQTRQRPETQCVSQLPQKPVYMGNVSRSKSGKRCLRWSDLEERRLDGRFRNLASGQRYRVFLPETSARAAASACRSAVVLHRRSPTEPWLSDESLFIDGEESAPSSENQPWCLVEGQGGNISREFCDIRSCANDIQSIHGVMHVMYKPHVLSKLLGHDSKIEILDCRFGSVRCTHADFVTLQHPQHGPCFRFNSSRFLRGLGGRRSARRKLSVKLFADDHSLDGQPTPSFRHVSGIVSGPGRRRWPEQPGYRVLLLPPGRFPAAGAELTANTGSHSEFSLHFRRSRRVAVKDFRCSSGTGSKVTYFLPTWASQDRPVVSSEDIVKLAPDMDSIDSSYRLFDSLQQTYAFTQDTCINDFILRRFLERCGCLPYFLPVPQQLLGHSWCYQWNASGTQTYAEAMLKLVMDDSCSAKLIESLEDISSEGWSSCRPDCEQRWYNVQQINKYWPDIFHQGFMRTLEELLSQKGFPKTVSPELGLSMLFYTYQEARSILNSSNATVVQKLQQMMDAARSNLAWISISSQLDHGLMTEEEVSYTMNNLLAELGGALGLWCGISLLTVCELLELLGCLCRLYCRLYCRRFGCARATQQPPDEAQVALHLRGAR